MSLTFVANDGTVWPFDGSAGVITVDTDEGIFTIPTDLIIDQRVAADGAVLVNERRSPRRVVLEFFLAVDEGDSLLQLWASFFSALAQGGYLVYDGPNGERTLRNIVLEGPDRSMTGHDLQHRNEDSYQVALLALDPWWYGPLETVTIEFAAPTAWDAAIAWDAIIPWNGGGSVTLDIEGHAPAFPIFVAKFGMTTLTVSSGGVEAWVLDTVLPGDSGATDVVTVDHRPGYRGPRYGSEFVPGHPLNPVAWGLLSEDSSVTWGIPVGSSTVIVGATGTGGSSVLDVYWETRWLTP